MIDWVDEVVGAATKSLEKQGFTVICPHPYDDALFVVSRVDHSFFVYLDHLKVGYVEVVMLKGDWQAILDSSDPGNLRLGEMSIKRPPTLSGLELTMFVKQVINAFETF